MTVMIQHLEIVIVAMLSIGCANAAGKTAFKITTKRDNDKVEITVEKDKTLISVRSPVGISQAVVERLDGEWSDSVMLRLHLKGLESFKLSNGKVTLEAIVSSHDGTVRLWKDGKEDSPPNAKSPYWMEIRLVGKGGKPVKTIPLKDGYFETQLPKALFADNPKAITLNWVDFYR